MTTTLADGLDEGHGIAGWAELSEWSGGRPAGRPASVSQLLSGGGLVEAGALPKHRCRVRGRLPRRARVSLRSAFWQVDASLRAVINLEPLDNFRRGDSGTTHTLAIRWPDDRPRLGRASHRRVCSRSRLPTSWPLASGRTESDDLRASSCCRSVGYLVRILRPGGRFLAPKERCNELGPERLGLRTPVLAYTNTASGSSFTTCGCRS